MEPAPRRNPRSLLEEILALKKRSAFSAIVAMEPEVPDPLTREWLPVADEVAFALCHEHKNSARRGCCCAPGCSSPRSGGVALAYHYYDALSR